MGRLFRFEREGDHETVFSYETGKETNPKYLTEQAPESYFALVTKDVVPGSRATTQEVKDGLLKPKGSRLHNSVNEAATAQLIMNLGPSQEKRGYFFGKERGNWSTYAEISVPNKNGVPLAVGAASPSGPRVDPSNKIDFFVGAAAVWEVPNI